MCDGSSIGKMPVHEVDVVICVGQIPDSTLIAHRIATVRPVTCASLEFIKRHGIPEAPADLPRTSCIALLDPGTGHAQEWLFRRREATYTVSPAAPLSFSDADSAVTAAVRGGGYVRVLSIEADQRIAAGLLQPVLEEWNDDSQPVAIVRSQDRVASEEITAFAAFVAGLFPLDGDGPTV